MRKQVFIFLFLSKVILGIQDVYAQTPPIITYDTPKTFTSGTSISTLIPHLAGGAVYPGIYNKPILFATFDTPFSIAIDGLNNVYSTDNTTGDILKFDASGNIISIVNTGNSQASGIAIDKLGNIFVSQFTANSVLKYNSAGKLIATITGFNDPYGIAFDASNNAYVADYLSGNIIKIAANDTVATTFLSGLTTPYGLAIDSNGNIYVGEQSVGDIIKIAAGTTNKTIFASGFDGPRHLSKDNFDNIYVADYGNNAVKRINPAGNITTLLSDGVNSPRQAAFDSNGNLFFADFGTNTLQKSVATTYSISAPLPLGLNFDTSTGQISGTPSTTLDPTNFIVTASNTAGTSSATINICVKAPTQALALPIVNALPPSGITTNSATINGFANSNGDNTATVSFIYGLTADLSGAVITITPSGYSNVEAGTNVAFTASGLNPSSTYYYKVISTNSSGTTTSSTASFTTLAPVTSNDATLSSLTLNQGTLFPVFSSNVKLYADTVNSTITSVQLAALTNNANATVTINGTAIINGAASNTVNLNTGNNAIVVVVTAQDGVTSNTYTLNIYKQKTPQTINFPAFIVKTYGDVDFDPGASATIGLPVLYTSDNPAVATIVSGKIHIIGAGTANITVSQPGDATYLPSGAVTQTLTINKAPLTINANNSSIAFGEAIPAFTFTYNGFVNGDDQSKLSTPVVISTTATSTSTAGTYPITLSGAASNNYSFTYKPGVLTIGQNNSTISFAAIPAKTYGDADFMLNATASSGLPVSYTSSNNNIAVVNGNIVHIIGAGNVTITASQPGNTNYTSATSVAQAFTVNKAPLTITANSSNIVYGQAIPAFTILYSGFVNGDDPGKLITAVATSTTATATSPAGSYPITLGGAASSNYSFIYQPGMLTIGKANSSFTFNPIPAKTYGDADFVLISTSNTNIPVTYTSSDNSVATINGNMLHIVTVGAVTITGSQSANANYSTTGSIAQTLTINKAPLTIAANNSNILYGQVIPALTVTYSGFMNGDNFGKLISPVVISTTATAAAPAGTYPVSLSGAASNNYAITYQPGTLIIGQNNSTISFAPIAAKTYGDADFMLTATASSGLPVSYTSSDNTVATVIGNTVHIIGAGAVTITAVQPGNTNYNPAASVTQTLTINKANITVSANAQSKTYGDADQQLTYKITNGTLYNSDSFNGGLIRETGEQAGDYIIKQGSLTLNNNYTLNYVADKLTINKAPLTITANNSTINYGQPLPAFTVTYSGFVNGDNPGKLAAPVIISTTATATSSAGVYPINLSGAVSNNYFFIYKPGTLTIGQNNSVITFTAIAAKTYGDADFTLNATSSSSLAINYSSSDNSIATVTGNSVHILGAGTAIITATQPGNINYSTASSVAQILTINKATLTITANNSSIAYGQAIQVLTATYGGFVNGDNAAKLTAIATGYTTAAMGSAAGIYPITFSGAASNNYLINYQAGTLTIGQNNSSIIFTAIPAKTYGDADFDITSSVNSGLPVTYTSSNNNIAVINGNTVHIISAGTITITASQPGNVNYAAAASVTQTLAINKAIVNIVANAQSKTYGDTDQPLTYKITNGTLFNGDTFSGALTRDAGEQVGIYNIKQGSLTLSNNYTLNYVADKLTINKATLIVTANNSSIAYGQALPSFTVTYSGFVNGDNPGKLTAPVSINTVATINSQVGAYPITLGGAASNNYSFIYQPGILIIGQNNSSITFAIPAKTYGDADITLISTSTSGLPVIYTSNDNTVATISGNTLHIIGAGTAIITATQPGNTNYTSAGSVAQILTVNKAQLTIAANNINITYGQALPALTATYTGFVNGDNAAKLSSPIAITTTATAGSAAGIYPISVNGAASNNYAITYQPGAVTIGQNNSTINFAAITAKTYGDADFTLNATSTSGLPVSYTSSNSLVATVNGNTVHIIGAGTVNITAIQPGNANYTATPNVTQTLTVSKANVTVTANAQSKTYGDADMLLTYKITSGTLFNGDTFSGTLARDAGEQAGAYNINQGSVVLTNNYVLTYVADKLTINKAPLIITANNSSINYGQPIPAFTVTYSGFVNGDNPGKLTAPVVVSTTATTSSSAGAYPISVSGAASNNYLITFKPGIFTIGQNNSSITFAAVPAKTYGDADFTLTAASTSGLPVNYSSSDNAIATINGNILHIIGAGTVIITASQPGNTNYTAATSVTQTLTINKAPLTINANNSSIAFGEAIPAFTFTYNGFVNGDDQSKLSTPVVISTTATSTSTAGTYPITLSGAASNNYSFTYKPGVLTIGQNNSTISFAAIPAKTYGDADFMLNATASSGLPVSYTSSNNNIAVVNGNIVHIIGAGNVTITASQPGNTNYTSATSVAQAFTVNKAPLTITANSSNIVYGQAIPAFTILYSGFVNGDDPGKLITAVATSTTATTTSLAGFYPITLGGAASSNYSFIYQPGLLTIGKANSSFTFNSIPAKTYGDADFVLISTSNTNIPVTYTSSDNSVATINGNMLHIVTVGAVTITGSQSANANYSTTGSIAQTLTINKAPLTIAANNTNILYGQVIPALTVTYSGFMNGDNFGKLISPVVISTTATAAAPAGTYPVSLSGAASNNYAITYQPGTLIIGQNNSTISFAPIAAKTYGDADFMLTATASSNLPVSYTSSDNTVATVNGNTVHIIGAGNVAITAVQPGNTNYNPAASVTQTLTINKANITVSANNISIAYGDAIPALTVTYNGFVNNDDAGKLKTPVVINTTAAINTPAGVYPIKLSGATSDNYTIVYHPGTITIGQISSSINFTAIPSKTYGDADFVLTANSPSGSQINYTSSDNSIAIITGNNVHIVGAGLVNITASQAANANYTSAGSVNQALIINKAQLTVKADNINIGFGDKIPKLTFTYSGFVNGDKAINLTAPAIISTTATANSAIGNYLILVNSAASNNYDITYQSGTLTIGQNSSSLSFDAIPSKTYGDLDFALIGSSTASLPIIYTSSDNNVALVTGNKVHIVGAGTVNITASQTSTTAISLTQTLIVNKAQLTVKANDINVLYNDNIPRLSVTYIGFVNGDDATKLITLPGLSVPAIGGSAVGRYIISVKGAVSDNYSFVYQPGTLTISQNNSVTLAQADDGITVHPAVSPNGDGINDFLMIEGIEKYLNNKIAIVNRSGALVSQIVGYDNASKVFDGHSNITGVLLQPGTYYYKIEYVVDKSLKSKTGFFVLKY